MTQLDLMAWTPPQILGPREGETYNEGRDRKRLDGQAADVFEYMAHGDWRTLADIASNTGHPEASVSARLRDLRKSHLGGFTVERRYIAKGLYQYRVVV